MPCADDSQALGDELIADRTAALCEITEAAWRRAGAEPPVYIIGSEVPVPGVRTRPSMNSPSRRPRRRTRRSRRIAGRSRAMGSRRRGTGCGLVVQPGVEFDHHQVIDYVRSKAAALSAEHRTGGRYGVRGAFHRLSNARRLEVLVQDHFAILKVGPGVTFALREVLWAAVGHRVGDGPDDSSVPQGCGARGDAARLQALEGVLPRCGREHFDLQYSLSDRIRYYWADARSVAGVCAVAARTDLGRLALDPGEPVSAGAICRYPRRPPEKTTRARLCSTASCRCCATMRTPAIRRCDCDGRTNFS